MNGLTEIKNHILGYPTIEEAIIECSKDFSNSLKNLSEEFIKNTISVVALLIPYVSSKNLELNKDFENGFKLFVNNIDYSIDNIDDYIKTMNDNDNFDIVKDTAIEIMKNLGEVFPDVQYRMMHVLIAIALYYGDITENQFNLLYSMTSSNYATETFKDFGCTNTTCYFELENGDLMFNLFNKDYKKEPSSKYVEKIKPINPSNLKYLMFVLKSFGRVITYPTLSVVGCDLKDYRSYSWKDGYKYAKIFDGLTTQYGTSPAADIEKGFLRDNVMFSYFRSVAWTLKKYAMNKGITLDDLTIKDIESVNEYIDDLDSAINYRETFDYEVYQLSDYRFLALPCNYEDLDLKTRKEYSRYEFINLYHLRDFLSLYSNVINIIYKKMKVMFDEEDYSFICTSVGRFYCVWCSLQLYSKGAFLFKVQDLLRFGYDFSDCIEDIELEESDLYFNI